MKKKDGKSASSGPHCPSLLKSQDVVNLVVQAHGKKDLARACTDDETPETVPEGWFCIHEKYISKCHLRFPLPTLLLDLLDHYQLALSQLCPSVIRVVNGFNTRAKEGVIVGLTELMSLFLIKESSTKEGGSGNYDLPCRPGLEIKDPVKLSGKLTRALCRKLQHSPNTWGAYTTTRIGSARFPDRYKASFPDSVTVDGLEVSEGESVVSVSSEASTSEKTQSHKMPIQPSFRSRGSAPVKDASCSEPRVQEVVPHSEVPETKADPQVMKDTHDFEPPRSKRGGTVGWNFTHSKPGSVLDDSWGLATLMRHMKRTGCALPSIANLMNKEEYVEIAHCMGQLAGAVNRAQLKFEDAMHNATNAGELAQVTEIVKDTKTELDQARVQVSELQAEVKRLGSKADLQQGKIESQAMDIQVKGRKITELESARKIAEYQVKELITSSQDKERNKEAEEKFSKKKDEVDLLIYAQELQANTELLKDMLNNDIKSAEDEYNRLMAMMPEAAAAYKKAQVSDFSITPVEATPGDYDKEMEEEVPDKEDEPVDKGAEKRSGDKEV
ncbi:uncharacterized protein LOC108830056 [Raphanus sativus]|uniref:Uncharacterized protein LOC108830056 n=1 Tax=Raphanus sativus TaxID=3726 RepID=A0A9W3DJN1_RAPSA|nr:uncharacterized protein LOC108830056 [Raphanus sativus]